MGYYISLSKEVFVRMNFDKTIKTFFCDLYTLLYLS